MKLLALLIAALPLFAGQDITLSADFVYNSSIPGIAPNAAETFEWSFNSWGSPTGNQHPVLGNTLNASDLNAYWVVGGATPTLAIYSFHETGATGNCEIPITTQLAVTVRYQRVPATTSTGYDVCQAWDQNGVLFWNGPQYAYTGISAGAATAGITIGATTVSVNTSYIRMSPGNVSLSATPPVTAQNQTGMVFQWKFDLGNNTGSLTDSTGNGYTGTYGGGSGPTYANTPYQGSPYSPVAIARTCNAPSWSTWISMPVGGTGCLSGVTSYSQSDASPAVTYAWSNVTGPATPGFSAATSGTTNVTGQSVMGAYTFALVVTDSASNTATVDLVAGAVPMTAAGVVVPADPNVAKIFGPLMAFGYNPWGYHDERMCTALNLQATGTTCAGASVQSPNQYYTAQAALWSVPATGTVSYPFAGIGWSPGQIPGCALSGNINATTLSIPISNAQNCPGLTTLPTWLMIGTSLTSVEVVRIVATSATTGSATLTVGYDGRGLAGIAGAPYVVRAQAWTSGTAVGEDRISGSGTQFATDAARPLCPAGVPGPPGPVTYSTGTVTFTASSTTVTLSGGTWTSTNAPAGGFIRVPATHGGGTAFIYWASIQSLTDSTHIVVDHPAPADIDATAFSYALTGLMYFSPGFSFTPTGESAPHTYYALQNPLGCESATAAFVIPSHDIGAVDITNQTGQTISYKTTVGAQSAFGPNFYGTGLALREGYEMSGYTPWLTAANLIDDYWLRDPEECGGLCGGNPLELGGGVIGGIADIVLNSSALVSWPDAIAYATSPAQTGGTLAAESCNGDDTRDTGYQLGWLGLAGMFDLNATRNPNWITALTNNLTRDTTCRRNASDGYAGNQVNSWATGFDFVPAGPGLVLTNGSATVTGTGFASSMCAGVASGTISVVNGSASATIISGTIIAGGIRITITDTTSSPIYVGGFIYSNTGSAVTLAGIWPGATGTFNWTEEGNSLGGGYESAIGISNADWSSGGPTSIATGLANNTTLQKFWACTYNSATQLTLNRPWDGSNTTSLAPAYIYSYVLTGFEQQPFMLGIKTAGMKWASQVANSTVANGYAAMLPQAGTWMAAYGLDSNTLGTYYGRVNQLCEPFVTANSVTLFSAIHDGSALQSNCGSSGLLGDQAGQIPNEFPERVDTAEAGSALLPYFYASPSANLTVVDKAYGAVWGNPSMTTAGYYSDNNYVNTAGELSNGSLGAYKWTGFFFGVGGLFDNTWPAIRRGGLGGSSISGVTISGGVAVQ